MITATDSQLPGGDDRSFYALLIIRVIESYVIMHFTAHEVVSNSSVDARGLLQCANRMVFTQLAKAIIYYHPEQTTADKL